MKLCELRLSTSARGGRAARTDERSEYGVHAVLAGVYVSHTWTGRF
jgi:hypothetical protein